MISALRLWAACIAASVLLVSPAAASDGSAIPEPANLALVALGVLGVVIGRQGSRRRPRD